MPEPNTPPGLNMEDKEALRAHLRHIVNLKIAMDVSEVMVRIIGWVEGKKSLNQLLEFANDLPRRMPLNRHLIRFAKTSLEQDLKKMNQNLKSEVAPLNLLIQLVGTPDEPYDVRRNEQFDMEFFRNVMKALHTMVVKCSTLMRLTHVELDDDQTRFFKSFIEKFEQEMTETKKFTTKFLKKTLAMIDQIEIVEDDQENDPPA